MPEPGEEEAELSVSDVPGAYYRGNPKPVEHPKGRVLYSRIGRGWEKVGLPAVCPATGTRMVLYIRGNLPGRQDAGAIWSDSNTAFMGECGLTQSAVDRQVFYKLRDRSRLQLAIGTHVDDNIIISCNAVFRERFIRQWEGRYGGKTSALQEGQPLGFLGSSIEKMADGSIEVGGERLYQELENRLAES
jgi:hypothetical protein